MYTCLYLNMKKPDRIMPVVSDIRERIGQLERTSSRLKSIMASLKTSMNITPFEMGIKSLEKRYIRVEPVQPPFEWYNLEIAIKKIITGSSEAGEVAGSGFMVFVDVDEDRHETFKKVALELDHESTEVIPGGEYAYFYHKGPYEKLAASRSRLLDYVDKSGYRVAGEMIEKVILDSFAVANEADFLVELQVPVEK